MLNKLLYLFLFLCLALPHTVWADVSDNQKQLNKIKARIEKAQQNLKQNRTSELKVSRELAVLKKTLQRIDSRIKTLVKDQKKLRNQVSQQKKVIKENRNQTHLLTSRLKKRLIALYKEGETGPLKILFSADSPTEMVQQYHYLTKVLEHDKVLLDEYRAVFAVQKQQLDKLKSFEMKKSELLSKEQQQRKIAADGRLLNKRLLTRAKKDKNRLKQELKQLKENSARLKGLITKLKKQPVNHSGAVANHFAVGRGKLRWPVEGHVVIGFGTQKDSKLGTYYESNGVEIAARPGTPVKAVASGKIVFADYFKGYGNLYILSHPGGYHTLYAQTDRMQKKVGADVSAGTLLGYSGLAGRDSIYFEIRSKGSPVNPLSWLTKR
jgi:murein hydrolase activator